MYREKTVKAAVRVPEGPSYTPWSVEWARQGGKRYRAETSKKSQAMHEILGGLPSSMLQSFPGKRAVLHMLQTHTAEDVLGQFVWEYQSLCNIDMDLVRAFLSEYYTNTSLRTAVFEHFIKRPAELLEDALDVLAEQGALPACDSWAVSRLWYRINYMYVLLHCCGDIIDGSKMCEEHEQVYRHFVRLLTCGGDQPDLPVESFVPRRVESSFDSQQNALYSTAIALFENHGFDNVTLQQILQESGLAGYTRYSDKYELLHDCCNEAFDFCYRFGFHDSSLLGNTGLLVLAQLHTRPGSPLFSRLYRMMCREPSLYRIMQEYLSISIYRYKREMARVLTDNGLSEKIDPWAMASIIVHAKTLFVMETAEETGREDPFQEVEISRLSASLLKLFSTSLMWNREHIK